MTPGLHLTLKRNSTTCPKALVLRPVEAIGVDRVSRVVGVAEDAEHGGRVPGPVVGDVSEGEPVGSAALVALEHHREGVAGQMRDGLGDLGPLPARQRRGKGRGRRAVLDGEQALHLADGRGLVLDDVTVGRIADRALALGCSALPGALELGTGLALTLGLDLLAGDRRVHVGGETVHGVRAVDARAWRTSGGILLRCAVSITRTPSAHLTQRGYGSASVSGVRATSIAVSGKAGPAV